MLTRNSALVGALLLAIQLTVTSAASSQTRATAQFAEPFSTGPKAYIALPSNSEVAVVDTRTNRVLDYIVGLLGAHDLIASPDGRSVYVATDGLPTVSVIDTSTHNVIAAIRVGFDPSGLALSPDGRQLLVSLWSANEVVSIDTASYQISGHIPIPWPGRSAISPDGRRAYVISLDNGGPSLTVLDLPTHNRIGRVPLRATPVALNFGSGGRRLYLMMADMHGLLALDIETDRIVARIAVPAEPGNLTPTQDGRSMLVVSRGTGALDLVDLVGGFVSGTIMVGKTPTGVAVGPDERIAIAWGRSCKKARCYRRPGQAPGVDDALGRRATAVESAGYAGSAIIVVNTVTLVATQIQDSGSHLSITVVGTPVSDLVVVFNVQI